MARTSTPRVVLVIPVHARDDRWVLTEENSPETPLHERIVGLLAEVRPRFPYT